MKYLKKYGLFEFVNETEIHSICEKYGIENYTINKDGSIDVDGDVNLGKKNLVKIPLNFKNVIGNFMCDNNNLLSLKGSPVSVGGQFSCSFNLLKSLKYSPKEVGGDFDCYNNQLMNLKNCPEIIKGQFFDCSNNKIKSLDDLLWKSFNFIYLKSNPIYHIVALWINSKNSEELIEYFIDMNIIQEKEGKNKLILPRLKAFYDDSGLEMKINFNKVKKYYEIIE